jgi:hypothetical protein
MEWWLDQTRRRYRVRPARGDDLGPIGHEGERITIIDRQTKTWWVGLPVLSELTPDGHWEDTDEWATERIRAEIVARLLNDGRRG